MILTPSKSRCCIVHREKNESNLSFLQIPFLVTNICLEEKKDVISCAPYSGH